MLGDVLGGFEGSSVGSVVPNYFKGILIFGNDYSHSYIKLFQNLLQKNLTDLEAEVNICRIRVLKAEELKYV